MMYKIEVKANSFWIYSK